MKNNIEKIRKTYEVIKNEIEIISGSKNSIDKELGYDMLRRGNKSSSKKI